MYAETIIDGNVERLVPTEIACQDKIDLIKSTNRKSLLDNVKYGIIHLYLSG